MEEETSSLRRCRASRSGVAKQTEWRRRWCGAWGGGREDEAAAAGDAFYRRYRFCYNSATRGGYLSVSELTPQGVSSAARHALRITAGSADGARAYCNARLRSGARSRQKRRREAKHARNRNAVRFAIRHVPKLRYRALRLRAASVRIALRQRQRAAT